MIDLTLGIKQEREYIGLLELEKDVTVPERPVLAGGLCEGAEFALAKCLAADMKAFSGAGCLIIVPDEKKVYRICEAFTQYGIKAYPYVWRDFVYRNITASHEFEHERLSVLSAVLSGNWDVIVTTPDASLQYTIPPKNLEASTAEIKRDGSYNIDELSQKLSAAGYSRCDMVDGAGQFSVRGGILDIFAPSAPNPVRIDFWGDEIDRMCFFDPMTQRQIEDCDSFLVIPSREVTLDRDARDSIAKAIASRMRSVKSENVKEALKHELDAVESGGELYCADKYISLVYPEKKCLLDYIPGAFTMAMEYNAVIDRYKGRTDAENENIVLLLEEGTLSGKIAEYAAGLPRLEEHIFGRKTVITSNFAISLANRLLSGVYTFLTKQTVSYGNSFDMLCDDLRGYSSGGYRVKVICENENAAKNLKDMLDESGFGSYIDDGENQLPATVALSWGQSIPGFELAASKYACLILSGENGAARRSSSYVKKKQKHDRNLQKIMSYADLNIGDYVVHAFHGIGQYLGLSSLVVEGVRRDFVKIKYADTDMLYLPCDQLDKVSKYIGARGEDGSLKLSKMGGTEWVKAKTRARSAAKDMAKELIALYAERVRKKGYAFPADDDMLRSFEDAFEYEETDGQLAAVDDVKADMRNTWPMDRLLCGDVGYGKTEVALRAAFKSAEAGKQVAILVPTTILALQHYRTMLSRMRGFPVRVDMISRFRSPAEQDESLRKLRRGETDIIVGTHRLLSDDVKFKDLGLLVIDEEQRFGVVHKEKLKQMSKNVDVLTLTATPIPRTLNMAMSGIRDMSILEEAPGDRLPVQTYVMEYDDLLISEAVKKELRRGGQVFYLCNRIENMDRVASKISSMVPDAHIELANGRMDKDRLADIWQQMIDGVTDVLVSTTIIETGIDLPNANTLIIEDADKLGLSQLHQLRGRVGRSSRRAYAYFTYPKGKVLTEISEKRLSAIRDFTEFGAGFKVAMRDLEIRGAGNILGAEQHGHMESIGYDLYMKLLNEAVLEEKGEKTAPKIECAVDFNVNAYIPESYIKNSNQRIDSYKKISLIENEEDMRDIYDEFADRYGEPPAPVLSILRIALIRALGSACGIIRIEYKTGSVLLYPQQIDLYRWTKLAAENKGKLLLNMSSKPYASYKSGKVDESAEKIIELLKNYMQITLETT